MNITDFLKKQHEGMRILLADRKSVGNALIRQCNRWEGLPAWNIKTMTVEEIAKEYLLAYAVNIGQTDYSDNEDGEAPIFISSEGACYQLLDHLERNPHTTFPKEILSMKSTEEINRILDELRLNGLKEDFKKAKEEDIRLQDLDEIRVSFSKELFDRNLYDRPLFIELAKSFLKIDGIPLEQVLPWAKDLIIGDLETNRWSENERDFINVFAEEAAADQEIHTVTFLPSETNANYSFHKAYGIANEVRFAGNEIVDIQKRKAKLPFDETAVYYSTPEYLNHIRGTFDMLRIPYHVTEKKKAGETNLGRFMISIIDAAEKDYLYKALEPVIKNPLLTFEKKNGDTVKSNPIRGYYRGILDGIGWGRQRYLDYYNRITEDKSEENASPRIFAGFLKDFVSIFEDEEGNVFSVAEMLDNLWKFTGVYTYSINQENKTFVPALRELMADLHSIKEDAFKNEGGSPLSYRLLFLKEALENLKISEEETEGSVLVSPINGFSVMERRHNFILGLSATSFTLDDKQSAVLLDEEKRRYIKGADKPGCSVDIATERNLRRREDLKNSLKTLALQKGDTPAVFFTYSYFDTVALRENSPSVLFLELAKDEKISEVPGFDSWENHLDEDILIHLKDIQDSTEDRAEEIKAKREDKVRKKAEKERDNTADTPEEALEVTDVQEKEHSFHISATGIQTILSCPLRYYYEKVHYLRVEDGMEPEGHEWLNASKKGNLCHYTMEKYMACAFPPAVSVEDTVNEEVFSRCYEDAVQTMIQEQPYPSKAIFLREKEYYKNLIHDYLSYAHESWYRDAYGNSETEDDSKKAWKVIDCELAFGTNYKADASGSGVQVTYDEGDVFTKLKNLTKGKELPEEYQPLDSMPGYQVDLTGSIDRVDGYVDENGTLHIRIIDYKTGKRDNKEKEILRGVQIQHILYAMAMEAYLLSDEGKAHIRKLFREEFEKARLKDINNYEFDWVGYTFPYENEENYTLEATEYIHGKEPEETMFPYCEEEDEEIRFPLSVRTKLFGTIGAVINDEMERYADFSEKMIQDRIKQLSALGQNPEGIGLSDFCGRHNNCKLKAVCRKWIGSASGEEEE